MALDPHELRFLRVLRDLDDAQILEFVRACATITVPRETVLIEEGDVDRSMLFVLGGSLEASVGRVLSTTLRRYGRGEQLGELSLLGLVPHRTATVRALEACDLLMLDEQGLLQLRRDEHPAADRIEVEALLSLAGQLREVDRRIGSLAVGEEPPAGPVSTWKRLVGAFERRSMRPPGPGHVLDASPSFTRLNPGLRARLADQLQLVGFSDGDIVCAEGESNGDAWIVAAGEVLAWRATATGRQQQLARLTPGTLFGHLSIIDGDSRTATVTAHGPAWLYQVPRGLVEVLVDDPSPDGRALRRCLLDALARQLAMANQRLSEVDQARARRVRPDLHGGEDLAALRRDLAGR